jgi:DNA polymerase-3 subunit epsilon
MTLDTHTHDAMMRQIFLDTETTGISAAQGHRIVEIGCVEFINRQPTGRTYHTYLNPERAVDPEAERVHGLSNQFLADKPKFNEEATKLIDFIQDAEIIIHNASFDVSFLDAEFKRLNTNTTNLSTAQIVAKITDSLTMARQQFPGKRNNLDALCDRLGIRNDHRTFHGALLDAQLLADVYIAMTRGQKTLIQTEESNDESSTHQHASTQTIEQASELLSHIPHDLTLMAIVLTEAQLLTHQSYLSELAKESKQVCAW